MKPMLEVTIAYKDFKEPVKVLINLKKVIYIEQMGGTRTVFYFSKKSSIIAEHSYFEVLETLKRFDAHLV